jgi:hypothetical protein
VARDRSGQHQKRSTAAPANEEVCKSPPEVDFLAHHKTSDDEFLEIKTVMRKKKSHPVLDQFSDEDMEQIKRYGEALSGGVTPFDEEVERHLARYETDRKKMEAAKGATH